MTNEMIGRGWHFPPRIGAQGGVMLTNDHSEIEQSIQIILMTPIGQRVMRPTFGCRIHELLFAPNNIATATAATRYIREALGMWEPRITVDEVVARPNPDEMDQLLIEILYQVNVTSDIRSLVYPFYLIPEE